MRVSGRRMWMLVTAVVVTLAAAVVVMSTVMSIVYAGYHTDRVAWVAAVGLAGETGWTRQVDSDFRGLRRTQGPCGGSWC